MQQLQTGNALTALTSETAREVFDRYYSTNKWGGEESRSGKGSSKDRGIFLSSRLPYLLKWIQIESMLDIPCGDMNWMSDFPLGNISYLGADIVPAIISDNIRAYSHRGQFHCLDACVDQFPATDLIFCRDMIIHLPNDLIFSFLNNVARSEARWLICTRYLGGFGPKNINEDIEVGEFRAVDLCEAPFHLPPPIAMVPEKFHKWKTLALWTVDSIRSSVNSWNP